MPIKLSTTRPALDDAIRAIRATIKTGEGLTMQEVGAATGRDPNSCALVAKKLNAVIRTGIPGRRGEILLLVNETDYKKYAGKSQS